MDSLLLIFSTVPPSWRLFMFCFAKSLWVQTVIVPSAQFTTYNVGPQVPKLVDEQTSIFRGYLQVNLNLSAFHTGAPHRNAGCFGQQSTVREGARRDQWMAFMWCSHKICYRNKTIHTQDDQKLAFYQGINCKMMINCWNFGVPCFQTNPCTYSIQTYRIGILVKIRFEESISPSIMPESISSQRHWWITLHAVYAPLTT